MTISSFVNNLSGCSLSRASTLSLVIWNPCSSDSHFSPCFQCLHTYAPLSFIWNKPWYCKCSCRLKASWHLILKTWDKHIVKLSRGKKSLFYKNRFFFYSTFSKCHFSQSSYRMVISTIPCAMYSLYSEKGGKQIFVFEIRFWFLNLEYWWDFQGDKNFYEFIL